MARREQMSTSFGSVAGVYEIGRPDYPAEAVEWMLQPVRGPHAPRVVDVGAGTGKLTRAITAAGAEVVAVDPDLEMLAQLSLQVPGVPTFQGSGEHMPLPGASVDAVVFGQSWHWVDAEQATAECARVLRPGGVLALVWNVRDERSPWVQRLTGIMQASVAETFVADGGPQLQEPFGETESRDWEWVRPVTRDVLRALVASRSYVITAADEERVRILAEVDALFDDWAEGQEQVDVPYRTVAFRSIRS